MFVHGKDTELYIQQTRLRKQIHRLLEVQQGKDWTSVFYGNIKTTRGYDHHWGDMISYSGVDNNIV